MHALSMARCWGLLPTESAVIGRIFFVLIERQLFNVRMTRSRIAA